MTERLAWAEMSEQPTEPHVDAEMTAFPADAAVQLVSVTKRFGDVFDASAGEADDPDDVDDDYEDADDAEEQEVTSGATALSDISLTVPRGMFLAILGPHAAGKTTLIRMIAGTLVPSAGEIRVRGTVAPPPDTLLRLLEPAAAGADNMDLLARFLGLRDRVAEIDLATVYDVAGLAGSEDIVLGKIPRRQVSGLLASAVLHLRPDVYLFDPAPKIGDPDVRVNIDAMLAEQVVAGAVVIVTSESPALVPPQTDMVARLSLGRLAAIAPGPARSAAAPGPGAPATPGRLPDGSTSPLLLVGATADLERSAQARVVVDVSVSRVEVTFGFIFRRHGLTEAKVRSARHVLSAGCYEVVAYLGGLSDLAGQYSLEIGAMVGPEGEEQPIMWPTPLEVDVAGGMGGEPHVAWRVDRLEHSEVIEAGAVTAHEASETNHEQQD